MLHQCLVQWIGDEVEVVSADNPVCVVAADARVDDGDMVCLSGKNLNEYDYISVSRDGLIPVSVKPTSMTRLNNMGESC
jgi:3,4-dihydroxy-2-butanone 4-phosphate synthase